MSSTAVKGSQAAKVIALALSFVGYHEGRDKSGWNNDNKFAAIAGFPNGQAWCATFVCAVFKTLGLAKLLATPSPGCDQLAAGFKKAGAWSDYPAAGAVVFFGTPGDLSHTGVVTRFDDTFVWSVEGNTNQNGSAQGDGVYENRRERKSAHVVGYGLPAYADGIVSADPKLAAKPVSSKPSKAGLPVHGADLSHHQDPAKLDYTAAAKAGVGFCWLKATEGDSFVDDAYGVHRANNFKAGIINGAYHFARPKVGNAAAQAAFFLKHAGLKPGNLKGALDLEDDGGLTPAQLDVWAHTFMDALDAAGVGGVIYTKFPLGAWAAKYPLWIPRYSDANLSPVCPKPWKAWTVFQFSDGVFGTPKSIAGFGHCDLNTLAGDPAKTLAGLRIPAAVTPPAKPTKPAKPAKPPVVAAADKPTSVPAVIGGTSLKLNLPTAGKPAVTAVTLAGVKYTLTLTRSI